MHKKPLKLLVQIKVFSLQREQLANMINSVSVVPVKIFGYAEIDHNDIDGIITDWIPRQQYQNIPLFNLSSICGQWNFCELERFLRELSDGKF